MSSKLAFGTKATPPSEMTHSSPGEDKAQTDANPKEEVQDDHGNLSDAESYQSDYVDPALFDEEETPGGADAKPGASGSKPGYSGGYNAMKSFNGQMYSGMAIGGSHTWNYQPGVWKETKTEPDLWTIDYKTNKIRNHKAPMNSGAPVGTEYEWFIIARQSVKKIDANTYETHLHGSKYKLSHKNVSSNKWDIPTVKGQRERELFLLDDAKRRVEGLPPVHATEKIKVDKKEKGQATLGSFFGSSAASPAKRKAKEEPKAESAKKPKKEKSPVKEDNDVIVVDHA